MTTTGNPSDVDPDVVRAVCAMDRDTFAANPKLREILRPMALGEAPIAAADVPDHVVLVHLIAPGVRVRDIRRGHSSRQMRRAVQREVARRIAADLRSPRAVVS